MTYESDKYGSHHREELKRSMELPAINKEIARARRARKLRRLYYDYKDDGYNVASWVVGTFAVLFIVGVVISQFCIRRGWIP